MCIPKASIFKKLGYLVPKTIAQAEAGMVFAEGKRARPSAERQIARRAI